MIRQIVPYDMAHNAEVEVSSAVVGAERHEVASNYD